MFDALTDRLHSVFKNLTGDEKLTAENMEEAIREVRKSLLEADVSLKVVKIFISRVRQKALGADVIESVSFAENTAFFDTFVNNAIFSLRDLFKSLLPLHNNKSG